MAPVLSPLLAFAIGMGLSADTSAAAQQYATRDVSGWTVSASSDGQGCFLSREYDRPGHTTLLLGVDGDGSNHVSVLNSNWSIRPKDRLKLNFRLSKASYPRHFAVGMAADGQQGFVTSFGKEFPAQFAASNFLNIVRGDVPVERLDLGGSGAAVAELRTCLRALRASAAQPATRRQSNDDIPEDPFAATTHRSKK